MIFCQQRIQIPDILIAALERNKWAAKDLKINLFRKTKSGFLRSNTNALLRVGKKQIWQKKNYPRYICLLNLYISSKNHLKSLPFLWQALVKGVMGSIVLLYAVVLLGTQQY